MSQLKALVFAALLGGGMANAAKADVWPGLLPAACADVANQAVEEAAPTLTEPLTFASAADLARLADRQARASGQTIGDAQWLVAKSAAAIATDAEPVKHVLKYLRALWIGGDHRASLLYGQLAVRWPDFDVTPSADQALASAAVTGNPDAMLAFARINGSESKPDPSAAGLVAQAKSVLWSQVTGGRCRALLTLARLELDPITGKTDPSLAADLFGAATDLGVPEAAVSLATLLLSGDGVPYDLARTLALLEKESTRGTHGAMLMLARLSMSGPLAARDAQRGERLAAEVAAASVPESRAAAVLLAEKAAGRFGGAVDHKRVADLLAMAERAEGGEGWDALARAYLEGWSGSVDVRSAERALAEAARSDNPDALAQIAELQLLKEDASPDAVRLLREAAEKGSVAAMLRLRGLGAAGSVDHAVAERARTLLREATGKGSDQAALAVAQDMFHDAIVGEGAREESRQALRAGAQGGSIVAALELKRAGFLGLVEKAVEVPAPGEAGAPDANGAPERLHRIGRAYDGRTSMGKMPESAAALLQKCADLGDVGCHADLAALSEEYPNLDLITAETAERSRRIAADAGRAGAMIDIAETGAESPDELVRRAAELNYLPAMFMLIAQSRGHPDRYAEAIRLFERAQSLAASDIERSLAIGRAYRDGDWLPKDPQRALQTFMKAATLGSGVAMREVADLQLTDPLPEVRRAGLEWLERAASLGDVASMERLSRAYFDGWLGAPDAKAGFRMARLAAARGSTPSKRIVAEALEGGIGTPADPTEASKWRQDSADSGDAEAMVALAERALSEGPQHDKAQALAWFRRAASQGNDSAMFRLGQLQAEGQLGAHDEASAESLFKAAADHGNLLAIYTVSRLRAKTHPAPTYRHQPTRSAN